MEDYACVDTDHDLGGIDIGGIKNESSSRRIHSLILQATGLPFSDSYFENRRGMDPGWHVRVYSNSDVYGDKSNLLGASSDELPEHLTSGLKSPMYEPKYDAIREARLVIGYALIKFVDKEQDGRLLSLLSLLRTELCHIGVLMPTFRISDDLELCPTDFQIVMDGKTIERSVGQSKMGAYVMAQASKQATLDFQH